MATLKIVREGRWAWIEKPRSVDVTCTTTLIEDGGKRILVDVPNPGEERELLAALAAHGLGPEDVDVVVFTHFHPDHTGCASLFTKAEFVSHHTRGRGATHVRWEEEALPLTDDVYALKTPGHTDSDCSVVVNAEDGVWAVAGDLWVRSPSDPRIKVIHDKAALEASRKRLIGLADRIVPGHGPAGPSSEAAWQIP
jgi:glyoxylase-like metal-dependent hydrolase (beta-lactamase superfamily II)